MHIGHDSRVTVCRLWRGTTPSLLGVSEGMIQFAIYEKLKLLLGGAVGGYAWCGVISKVKTCFRVASE